ncbi:MAG: transglutaminase domain-containing protein [Candidatus Electrothrix sp. EH2]|nr:transglutaminase domain-containing protein [Candidatus Electrothrix sp. EH2]
MPIGAYRLENLPVTTLKQTPLGAVKVEEGPGLIGYRVRYNPKTSRLLEPSESDLLVPPRERPALEQIAADLHLHSKTPEEIVRVLADFFQDEFAYSLKLRAAEKGKTSLATFLLSTRTGHCEYFATATVLMLRVCGIPARYATGWSAHEFSRLEQEIIVRSRHAHAWTLVYLNGLWHNLDTTSASWIEIEDEAASELTVLQDIWSFILFRISRWRWGAGQGALERWWWLLLIPLIIILLRRLSAGKKIRRVRAESGNKTGDDVVQEKDSGYYRIEKRLNELGFERNSWEPPLSWIRRLRTTSFSESIADSLLFCLGLHYQERFGKTGLTKAQQRQLNKEVDTVLEELAGRQEEPSQRPASDLGSQA